MLDAGGRLVQSSLLKELHPSVNLLGTAIVFMEGISAFLTYVDCANQYTACKLFTSGFGCDLGQLPQIGDGRDGARVQVRD